MSLSISKLVRKITRVLSVLYTLYKVLEAVKDALNNPSDEPVEDN